MKKITSIFCVLLFVLCMTFGACTCNNTSEVNTDSIVDTLDVDTINSDTISVEAVIEEMNEVTE